MDRPAFGVHLDPCNLVNSPEKFYRNTALLNECFDKLGRWIVSCHAKDLFWEPAANVYFKEVRPGAGGLDYGTYLARLVQLPHSAPLADVDAPLIAFDGVYSSGISVLP